MNRGISYECSGDFADAIADQTRAIQLDPTNPIAFVNRSDVYRVSRDYEKALADVNRAIQLGSKDETCYYNRGQIYFDMGEYDKAIADFSVALKLDPGPTVYTMMNLRADLTPKGFQGFCLSVGTESPNLERGRAYLKKGDYEKALADYTEGIRLDPKHDRPYRCLGSAYAEKGDYDKAIAGFNTALHIAPDNSQLFLNRGLVYGAKGDLLKAATDLIQAGSHAQSAADYEELARNLATSPQVALRNGKKAVKYATKAYQLSKWHDPETIDTLAAACAEAGDFKGAVKWQRSYLASPFLSVSAAASGKTRLVLYQAHQPYHTDITTYNVPDT
jgi:tetratricopeptide (TPR) repeat protein